jgi:hypothetical protein
MRCNRSSAATLWDVPFERFVVDGELVIELNERLTFNAIVTAPSANDGQRRKDRISQRSPLSL